MFVYSVPASVKAPRSDATLNDIVQSLQKTEAKRFRNK